MSALPPVFTFQGDGQKTYLYDLLPRRAEAGNVFTLTDELDRLRSAPPVAPPRFLSQ